MKSIFISVSESEKNTAAGIYQAYLSGEVTRLSPEQTQTMKVALYNLQAKAAVVPGHLLAGMTEEIDAIEDVLKTAGS